MQVRALSAADPGDVIAYKAIRLTALSTDPAAFGSTYEREAAFDDDTWRRRLAGFHGRLGCVFLAYGDGGATGSAGIGLEDPADHDGVVTAYLFGMWVDPRARRTGTSGSLVSACVAWAVRAGAPRIVLDVKRDNRIAIALYERHGFLPTRRIGGLPSDPDPGELEMCLDRGLAPPGELFGEKR